jgi:hypothetical protein
MLMVLEIYPCFSKQKLTLNNRLDSPDNEKGPQLKRAKSIQRDGGGDNYIVRLEGQWFSQKNTFKDVGMRRWLR